MADGAGNQDKLARLMNLRSGMKAKAVSSADDADSLEFDTLFGGGAGGDDALLDQHGSPSASDAGPAAKQEDSDPESLSAYFEALGIVPDSSRAEPVATASEGTEDPAPASKGRDVDIRDRWADPVREDDMFLASFAGDAASDTDTRSLDSIIGSFDEEENAGPLATDPEFAASGMPEISDAPSIAAARNDTARQAADAESEAAQGDPAPMEFGNAIDIDAFEREIALAAENEAVGTSDDGLSDDPEIPEDIGSEDIGPEDIGPEDIGSEDRGPEPEADPVAAPDDADGAPLSITFDAGRAATLAQVSEQMGCSVDDIVVTALDWYLDALFGEDGQMPDAEAGE